MSEPRIKETSRNRGDYFIRAVALEELKAAGMVVVRGARYPLLVVYDDGKVFALDNRCPHLGFPLHRGTIEDGILTWQIVAMSCPIQPLSSPPPVRAPARKAQS